MGNLVLQRNIPVGAARNQAAPVELLARIYIYIYIYIYMYIYIYIYTHYKYIYIYIYMAAHPVGQAPV